MRDDMLQNIADAKQDEERERLEEAVFDAGMALREAQGRELVRRGRVADATAEHEESKRLVELARKNLRETAAALTALEESK